MFRLNLISAAAVVLVLATGAQAADMPVMYEPEPVEYRSWYLRGDIGASHQFVGEFSTPFWDVAVDPVTLLNEDFDASFFFGVGVGYEINDMFRVDVTGEYRFQSDFHGLDQYFDSIVTNTTVHNEYNGTKEEAVFLLNGYVDLPSYGRMTPFVGAGIGASWIKLSDFSDYNATLNASGFSDDVSTWNFAFAAYAGLAFEINEQMTFEVGYRYLYLGDIETNDLETAGGALGVYNPYEFDDIQSHDIKVGLRYAFY